MIGIIGTLLGPIVNGVKDYVAGEQEIKKADKENRARLLRDKQSNNHDWEMANLTDKDTPPTGPRSTRCLMLRAFSARIAARAGCGERQFRDG